MSNSVLLRLNRFFFAQVIVSGCAVLVVSSFGACSCGESKDDNAKTRVLSAEKKSAIQLKAEQKLDANAIGTDEDVRRRINRMSFSEVALRLGSLKYHAQGVLSFERDSLKIKSSETVDLVQAKEGDFSLTLVTGDESRQEVALVHDIFFLKNNNGRWRISRDPTGEREQLREDSAGVWRSFYDLFNHALIFQAQGKENYEGRSVVRYRLGVKDLSQEARAIGENAAQPDPAPPPLADGGVVEADPKVENKKLMGRMSKWRKSARAAGGKGDMLVDVDTGVILKLKFTGKMVVGDGPSPATLDVRIDVAAKNIGRDLRVVAPKDAVAEITREKFPVAPRAPFEKKGLVKPLPKEGAKADKASNGN